MVEQFGFPKGKKFVMPTEIKLDRDAPIRKPGTKFEMPINLNTDVLKNDVVTTFMEATSSPVESKTNPEEKVLTPSYVSKNGFETVKVFRGFTEIKAIYELASEIGGIICGGYVRYMCSPAITVFPAGDLDIYFPSDEAHDDFIILMDEKYNLTVKHENGVSTTFSKITDSEHALFGSPTIQLIKPIKEGAIVATGTMETILENFDFTVVRIGLLSPSTAMADADFLHDEAKHILRLKNIHCPISSTLRCMKYSRKGYWLPPMQVVKLFIDWDNRDQEYRDKLVDFLKQANEGEGLTQAEVEQMEALMRID